VQIKFVCDLGQRVTGGYLHMLHLIAASNFQKKIMVRNRGRGVRQRHGAYSYLHRLVHGIDLNRLKIKANARLANGRAYFDFAALLGYVKSYQNGRVQNDTSDQQGREHQTTT
jgi:hypothetical protein